jgi:3D (Asp-Asp-Asp) domain-containing protein
MMQLARSLWMKAAVTTVAAGSFVWLYEVEFPDSKFATLPLVLEPEVAPGRPAPVGVRIPFAATAYCKGLLTSTGVAVQRGIAAADPAVLPVGSVLRVDAGDARYDGIYTVLDTGPQVQGREVDIYMWSCTEALAFGRKTVQLTLLREGWDPRATRRAPPGLFRPEGDGPPLAARPLPIVPSKVLQ